MEYYIGKLEVKLIYFKIKEDLIQKIIKKMKIKKLFFFF